MRPERELVTLRRVVIALAMSVGLVLVGSSGAAEFDCGSTFQSWSPATTRTGPGVPRTPAVDTAFNPAGFSYTYLSQGSTLLAIRNLKDGSGPAGSVKWTWQAPGLPTLSAAVPVLLERLGEFVFVTATDGSLYKIDADSGTTSLAVDTRRCVGASCADGVYVCPADALVAPPAVQLFGTANKEFKRAARGAGHNRDDLVFVTTANGCGDQTHNRVIAYWASDLTVNWTFNETGLFRVGPGLEACVVANDRNGLFCGTDVDPTLMQPSLWALDTTTGRRRWSDDPPAVVTRPILMDGRLYVTTKVGSMLAYDPAGNGLGGPSFLWTFPIAVAEAGAVIVRNPAAFSNSAQERYLAVVDSFGTLTLIRDEVFGPSVQWLRSAEEGVSFSSAPVFAPSLERLYVGRDDGSVQQLSLTGAVHGVMNISAGLTTGDPVIDSEVGGFRLVAATGVTKGEPGHVGRFNLPLCEAAPF